MPFSPVTAAALGVIVTVLAGTLTPRARESQRPDDPHESDDFGPLKLLTRVLGVAVLIIAVVAGRLGSALEIENIAPALIVGTLWPVLVLLSGALGRVWRWIDPFDSLARLGGGGPEGAGASAHDAGLSVAWATPVALAWTWYLSVYPNSLSPRVVGGALALYTIVIVAACLAVGRHAVLSRAELFGIFYDFIGRARSRLRRSWVPPRHADVLLAVLFGGLLFGGLRQSKLWGELNASPEATAWATLGLLGTCLASVVIVKGAQRIPRGDRVAVALGLIPVTGAVTVAVSLTRNRLTTSLQLLPHLILDPLGRADSGLSSALAGLDPNPFGTTGRVVVQMVVIVMGAVLGTVLVRRRFGAEGNVAVGVLCLLASVAIVAIAAV